MRLLAIEYPSAFVLALGGLITALSGFVSAIMAARRARDEERRECEEKLKQVRMEAVEMAERLYERRPGSE